MSKENDKNALIVEIHEELEKLLQSESLTEEQKISALRKIMDESSKECAQ